MPDIATITMYKFGTTELRLTLAMHHIFYLLTLYIIIRPISIHNPVESLLTIKKVKFKKNLNYFVS